MEVSPDRFLHVTAGGRSFGVPLRQLISVDPLTRVVPVPNTPRWLRGVTYRQGRVHSVVDLNALLEPGVSPPPDTESRLLVVADDDFAVAVLVSAATDVFVAPPEQVEPATALTGGAIRAYLTGQVRLADATLGLLDVRGLLRAPEHQVTGERRSADPA